MWFRLKCNIVATNKNAGTGAEEFHWLGQRKFDLVAAETVGLS